MRCLLYWKPFKNDKKCFLFCFKNSFRSQDIYVFVTTFWWRRKNGLIRRVRLTSKFMTSETGSQTIAIYILPNISQSKGNQTLKFGQLIEHYKRNIFLQRSCGKWVRETSSKLNMRWKQLVCSLVLIYFDSLQLAIQQKNKLCKILDYLSRDTLNFHFSEKALALVSPSHFVDDFSRKMLLMLHSTDQHSLSDCLYFSRYWTICVLQFLLTRLWRHKILN